MKDKYAALGKDYQDTIRELAAVTGWSEKQSEKVIEILAGVTQKQAETAARQQRAVKKNARVISTRKLLENYRNLKISISCGTEHSLRLLEDKEYQRLMEFEESIQNQNLRSTALLTASNRVLWSRLNTALGCYKEMCERDPRPHIHRGYALLYERYLSDTPKDQNDILTMFAIERSQYFNCLNEALSSVSVILFGSDCAEDFCTDSRT